MAEKKKADLAALSPEARAIIDTKKVSGRRRLREWFKLLKEVAAFDETVDELRARLNKQAIIFLVLTFVFFIISFPVFILGFPLLILIVTPILFVVFLVLTIVSFKKKGGLGKIDLANEFRETLIPFLQIISEDLHPKARIALELDMAGLADAKKVREEEIPPGRFRKVTETEYRDPWCKLEAPLVAGNRLSLAIDSTYISHDRHWRNPRGKSKHKTKWKKRVVVTAGLSPPSDHLSFNKEDVDALAVMEKVKLSKKEKGQSARLVRSFKYKSVNETPDETVAPDELVGMFLQLASALTPARDGSAS